MRPTGLLTIKMSCKSEDIHYIEFEVNIIKIKKL